MCNDCPYPDQHPPPDAPADRGQSLTDGGPSISKQPDSDDATVQAETPDYPSLAATPPEEEQAVTRERAAYAGALTAVHVRLVRDLRDPDVDLRLADHASVQPFVRGVFNEYGETLDDRFLSITRRGAEAGRAAIARRFNFDLDPDLDADDLRTRTTRALRDIAFTASDATTGRMTADIADAIVDGYRAGLHGDEIARRLSENVFPPMRQYEAERVVRTELHAGGERAKLDAFRDSNRVQKLMWVSAFLPTSRSTHLAATGQTRSPGQRFDLAGYAARYPGDPDLPVGERVNCQCRLIPVGRS